MGGAQGRAETVPALIRVLTEEERLTLALVDNISATCTLPVEAVAMSRIVELGASVTKVAKAIGRSVGYVRPAQAHGAAGPTPATWSTSHHLHRRELALRSSVDNPEVLAAVVADIAGD